METDVGHLIGACLTNHQRKLMLYLWGNGLSEEFENKWELRCKGTNIEPLFSLKASDGLLSVMF